MICHLWNVKGQLLHSGDHIVPCILTVDYTFNVAWSMVSKIADKSNSVRAVNSPLSMQIMVSSNQC